MNSVLKTFLLLGILSVIVITMGRIFGGTTGMYMAFGFALLLNGGMYFFSEKLALKMSRAVPMDKSKYPELYQMVEELARKMKIPMPKLYITPDKQANAFATGRGPGHASIAVTEGILQVLSKNELRGVLAHELAHVKNRDVLIATIAAVLASVISFLANMSLFSGGQSGDEEGANPLVMIGAALLIPIAASLIQMAISRQREFGADYTGAKTIGSGQELAKALVAIHDTARRHPKESNPALSSLYIGDPTGGLGGKMMKLLSTHPPVEERVKRLQAIQ
ncbi:MAG: zinc metalloprotease HtpX [Candidatus Levybacteria bacterium]|nr:zinc metalloprotease HtpX [Candidatus Levybacteria bacterium]